MTEEPELVVGDLVVYASHGVGRVVARDHETVVIGFPHGLLVTLPLDRAMQHLRPLATEAEILSVGDALRSKGPKSDDVWQKRLKTLRDKVSGGSAVDLAEVVRDTAHRDQQVGGRGEPGRLSVSERELYLKARRLLADEIRLSRGVDVAEADAWIETQLTQTPA